MGIYLNPTAQLFKIALASRIYVDKSKLIEITNEKFGTDERFICVSRPRRFGKTTDLSMLEAYYSKNADGKLMFKDLYISKAEGYERYLNNCNVIHINAVKVFKSGVSIQNSITKFTVKLLREIQTQINDVELDINDDLEEILEQIYDQTGVPFVFLVDEWDAIFREREYTIDDQRQYLKFLRNIFKDSGYIGLVYMTGILPIKKYGDHSAINCFDEFSMTNQAIMADLTGFTEQEVQRICQKYEMPFDEMKEWYNGYNVNGISIYNPRSVTEAVRNKECGNYWTKTETYEALRKYIQMDIDGLKKSIIKMIAGEEIAINPTQFQNDMVTFHDADDVLTLLVHLGYLTYNAKRQTVKIPNKEIQDEFIVSVKISRWSEVIDAINTSEELLTATLNMDNDKIAELVEKVHEDNSSVLEYNNENTLSCVLSLAYYTAKRDYMIYRELPTGKGYADLAFIPKYGVMKPAIIVELKWDKSVETALKQIEEKNYTSNIASYNGEILLVGINYDKASKKHACEVKKIVK